MVNFGCISSLSTRSHGLLEDEEYEFPLSSLSTIFWIQDLFRPKTLERNFEILDGESRK
jgi:hypothetical protein